jgi:PII-like signaling protein
MRIPNEAVLLRIFPGESDRWEHQPLSEAIVLKARELHLAGATVLRGPMGFGKTSHLHSAKILDLSMDLPLVIEIVDAEEKINAFLPVLDGMICRRAARKGRPPFCFAGRQRFSKLPAWRAAAAAYGRGISSCLQMP